MRNREGKEGRGKSGYTGKARGMEMGTQMNKEPEWVKRARRAGFIINARKKREETENGQGKSQIG